MDVIQGRRGIWLRWCLWALAAIQLVVGGWALFAPTRFFALDIVGMGMAYNGHLMMDYGAMTLASAVVLAVAAATLRPIMVRTSLAMYLVWSIPHFIIHLRMLDQLSPGTGLGLLIALGVAVLAPLALLAVSVVPAADAGASASGSVGDRR